MVACFDEKHTNNLIHLVYYDFFVQQSEIAGVV